MRFYTSSVTSFAVSVLLVGCTSLATLGKRATPKFFTKTPNAEVTQSGDVAVPANVNTTKQETKLEIKPGSTVTITYPNTPLVTPAFLTQSTVHESITAPVAHTPVAGPTANDIAKADGLRWYYLAGVVCGLGALVALWRGHPVNAAFLGGGAVLSPIIGNLVSSDAALRVILIVVGISAGLAIAYFILKRRHPEILSKP